MNQAKNNLSIDSIDEWHPNKNGDIKPTDVTAKNSKRVWWKCKEDHEWETKISTRFYGTGCPKCRNKIKGCSYNKETNEYEVRSFHNKDIFSLGSYECKEQAQNLAMISYSFQNKENTFIWLEKYKNIYNSS